MDSKIVLKPQIRKTTPVKEVLSDKIRWDKDDIKLLYLRNILFLQNVKYDPVGPVDAESTSNKCFKIYYQPLYCRRRPLGTDQKVYESCRLQLSSLIWLELAVDNDI